MGPQQLYSVTKIVALGRRRLYIIIYFQLDNVKLPLSRYSLLSHDTSVNLLCKQPTTVVIRSTFSPRLISLRTYRSKRKGVNYFIK